MSSSGKSSQADPLSPKPKYYALLITEYQRQAEVQRKDIEKLDKKFEALSEEAKKTKQTVKELQNRIAEAESALR
ncbi:hypothetical protein QM012_004056 [Aureobasidium pullulans]|uniref:Uncharacterized protein n=1 Tax=Aureobasidium pullulans TaxID=5580 RepID=A0ABR0T6L1_AURPU